MAKCRYSCDTMVLNPSEYLDFGMKNTSKVADFFIDSVYFWGIISICNKLPCLRFQAYKVR